VSSFPVIAPYGFWYVPKGDPVAQRELLALAAERLRAGLKMSVVGDGWFYFEGLWTGEDIPFTRER